uniref:Uncharacterized protein n=1 Tax=Anguilla anguilla TaxID=7936 RepID=A0A0E9RH87_ANGAN
MFVTCKCKCTRVRTCTYTHTQIHAHTFHMYVYICTCLYPYKCTQTNTHSSFIRYTMLENAPLCFNAPKTNAIFFLFEYNPLSPSRQ